jgi:hypothetical protein
MLSLLLLAAVLMSGAAGRGFGVAGAATEAAVAPAPVSGHVQPRVLGLGEVWRVSAQDETSESGAAEATCDVRGIVEAPAEGATVPAGPLTISGWAADIAAPEGTGITEVRISLDADPDQGGVPVAAVYGIDRADVVELLGDERFRPSGFALAWDSSTTTPGRHALYIQVQSACGWTGTTRTVLVSGPTTAGGATPATGAASAAGTPTVATTRPASTPTPAVTSAATLVFPTVALVTATPASAPAAAAPTAALVTATLAPSPTGTIPAPQNVTVAVQPFDGSIHLSWTAPPAMVTAYHIVVNEPDGTQRPIRDVPGSMTRAVVMGLDPRIGYSLSVVPIDAFGRRGTASAPVSTAGAPTATPVPTPTVPPYCTPVPYGPPICPGGFPGAPGYPGAPFPGGMACPPGPMNPFGVPGPGCVPGPFPGGGTFQVTATSSGTTATLTWTPLPGATSYTVWQGINGQPLAQVQNVGGATTASVPLSIPGAQYVFQVHALGPNNNEIGVSNITPPLVAGTVGVPGVGGPIQLTATSNGAMAMLTWTALPGATSYTVWQGLNGQPLAMVQNVGVATTAQIPLPTPGQYVFQVRALGPTGAEIGLSNVTPPVIR